MKVSILVCFNYILLSLMVKIRCMTKCSTLFIMAMLALSISANAQVTTNIALLKEASAERKVLEDANYQKAVSFTKLKGWDLVLTGKNNSKAYLIGTFEDGSPKYYTTFNNTTAAATTRTNQLWPGGASGLNLSGASANMKNKLAIWDGGKPLATHVELIGRITQKDAATTTIDHATHVTGTLMATGINPIAKGMAYGLQGILAYDFNNDLSEMTAEAPNIILSNHSYGVISGWYYNRSPNDGSSARWEFRGRSTDNEDYKFGYYDGDTQAVDEIAYNAPNYLVVYAAGNSRIANGPAVGTPYYRFDANDVMSAAGNRPASISSNDSYGIIATFGNAKNVLTIGAVNGLPNGYTKPQDVVMSPFSSWGPTDDGRIKPDLVADGINVTSTIATGNSNYGAESGTSMSAPNATGSLLLLQEYYSKLTNGVFMRSATLKGLAIHTADEAGDTRGPDYKFGWGLLNVEKAAAVIKAAIEQSSTKTDFIYENVLNNGSNIVLTVIANSNGPLVATVCWTDVKGSVDNVDVLNNPAKKLVNDLDLRITKGSTVYKPWVLNPLVPSAAATTGDNNTDNVERINIDSAVKGQIYNITLSHKGTLQQGSQAYSLIISGAGGAVLADNTFIVSPNPSNGLFRVIFKAGSSADLFISLTDMSGKIILTKTYANFTGNYIEDFTTSNLASGYYIVKVQHGDNVQVKKILIIN